VTFVVHVAGPGAKKSPVQSETGEKGVAVDHLHLRNALGSGILFPPLPAEATISIFSGM
jgi:hypothetical protein